MLDPPSGFGGTHWSPEQHVAQPGVQLSHLPPEHAPPSQPKHVAASPHAFAVCGTTHAWVAGSQQPPLRLPHSGLLQRHAPLSQLCTLFAAHCAAVPQRHPFGPGTQVSEPKQLPQLGPEPVRQAFTSTGRHCPNAQHPFGQLSSSQVQLPFTQRSPSLQGAKFPQRHAPATLQRSLVPGTHCEHTPASLLHTTGSATPASALAMGSQRLPVQQPPSHEAVVQMQVTPMPASAQTWPGLHEGFAPHSHTPLVQRSDRPPTPHPPQLAPFVPHVPLLCCA